MLNLRDPINVAEYELRQAELGRARWAELAETTDEPGKQRAATWWLEHYDTQAGRWRERLDTLRRERAAATSRG